MNVVHPSNPMAPVRRLKDLRPKCQVPLDQLRQEIAQERQPGILVSDLPGCVEETIRSWKINMEPKN